MGLSIKRLNFDELLKYCLNKEIRSTTEVFSHVIYIYLHNKTRYITYVKLMEIGRKNVLEIFKLNDEVTYINSNLLDPYRNRQT